MVIADPETAIVTVSFAAYVIVMVEPAKAHVAADAVAGASSASRSADVSATGM